MHKFVITGGHHNSALVVAKDLIEKGHKVIWVGHRHTSRLDLSDSAEYQEVTSAGIKFIDLPAGKLTRNLIDLLKIPYGIYLAVKLLKKTNPSAIISFGGYLGGTVALPAWFLGIPIFLHEQTVTAGRANKLIGHLAKRIYLTWPGSAHHFSKSKTMLVGLPLRPNLAPSVSKPLFSRKKPVLLVMGGKQGAHSINQFVFKNIDALLTRFNLVHQTGTNSHTNDYGQATKLQKSLGSLSDCYLPLGYIDEHSIGRYFSLADLYLGRSGAHIIYELAVLKIPSILVPLMTTHDSEQWKNAQILAGAGLSRVILPQDLTLANLSSEISKLQSQDKIPLDLPANASKLMVNSLLSELK